jgi:hypothetical protein
MGGKLLKPGFKSQESLNRSARVPPLDLAIKMSITLFANSFVKDQCIVEVAERLGEHMLPVECSHRFPFPQ